MEEKPTNTTEFAEKDKTDTATVGASESSPKNTLDLQKFARSLNEFDNRDAPPSLTWKEMKALKRSRYFDIKDKYDQAFVLQNKRTKQVAEIQAVSPFHACNMIGWKPNRVKVIDIVNVEERKSKIKENKADTKKNTEEKVEEQDG